MNIFLRYFPIIHGSLFTYCNIAQHKNPVKRMLFYTLINSLVISIFIASPLSISTPTRIASMLLFSCFTLMFKFHLSSLKLLFTIIISYGLSFGFYILSGVPLTIIYILILPHHPIDTLEFKFLLLSIGILHYYLLCLLFRTSQYKKGIYRVLNTPRLYQGVFISVSIILLIIYTSNNLRNALPSIHSQTSIVCIIIAIFIPSYWRYRIKQTYIENMRRLEVLSYENAIADRDKQILDLKEENAQLGRIIHKYRKVIPAMELSVMDLLQNSDELSRDNLKERSQALQIQLAEMREEPDNLLAQYQKGRIVTTQTGLHTIDAMIALMEKRAKQEQIRYKVQTEPDIRELALRSVKEPDLLHLLGDLLENAIHAESTTDTKELLIHFGRLNDCLLLEVLDSGVPFDIRTYQHLGQEAYTSHEQDGGSGTGLMDIWKIKREYKASLYIYEYESNVGNYTKKISFLFDVKNHFLLKTYRDKEIRNALIRGDLHVFPHETD